MTYYLKYLKYKNKYLELKNMIAGKGPLNEAKLAKIWGEREKVGKVYNVDFKDLMSHYSQYCWVSQPTKEAKLGKVRSNKYGGGFFLYRLRKDAKPFGNHVQHGNFAIWYLTEANLGKQKVLDVPVNSSFFNNSFKTTFDLPNIGVGRDFDWHHERNLFVYNTSPQWTYELKL